MNSRRFDHIDLRVSSLAEVLPSYEKFLPALGFSRRSGGEGWRTFALPAPDPVEFIWIVEAPEHQPNENRIAMWADAREEAGAAKSPDSSYPIIARCPGSAMNWKRC